MLHRFTSSFSAEGTSIFLITSVFRYVKRQEEHENDRFRRSTSGEIEGGEASEYTPKDVHRERTLKERISVR